MSDAAADPGFDAAGMRVEYPDAPLRRADLPQAPLPLLQSWLEAARAGGEAEANAMVLTTLGTDGWPQARTVLLKAVGPEGLEFFTNYGSAKAQQIAQDERVGILFGWYRIHRQVALTGVARRVPVEVSEAYFATRPRESQIAAWASRQSATLTDRGELEARVAAVRQRFEGIAVPRPPFWGGYRVAVLRVDFWAGRRNRLHDRWRYSRTGPGPGDLADPAQWQRSRLAP